MSVEGTIRMPRNAQNEIGSVATPVRQQRAKAPSKPTAGAPSAANNRKARPVSKPIAATPSETRDRATPSAKPTRGSPGLAHIQIGEAAKPTRRGRASVAAKPINLAPSPNLVEAGTTVSAEPILSPSRSSALPGDAIRHLILSLADSQKLRRFAIKAQQWCDRKIEALIVRSLGYDALHGTQESRQALFKRAAAIRKQTEITKILPPNVGLNRRFYSPQHLVTVLNSANAREIWDTSREQDEETIRQIARRLPIYEWARNVRGFGDLGLGIVVAEAAGFDPIFDESTEGRRRTIGEYRTVSGLWKYMGLAVINGQRQRKMATKADGEAQKYKPERRAECWMLADCLLRGQIRGELASAKRAILACPGAMATCEQRGISVKAVKKVEDLEDILSEFNLSAGRQALGPYGETYLARRAHTAPRVEATEDLPAKIGDYANPAKWTPGRCHNDAARVMFKALLRDLWIEWRRLDRMESMHAIAAE